MNSQNIRQLLEEKSAPEIISNLAFLGGKSRDDALGFLREWVIQAIATGLPDIEVEPEANTPYSVSWFKALRNNPTPYPYLLNLLTLYSRYFTGATIPTQEANAKLLGVTRPTLTKYLEVAYAWCAEAFLRREWMVLAGIAPSIVAELTEFEVADNLLRSHHSDPYPLPIWIQHELPGTGKTQSALQIGARLLTPAPKTGKAAVERAVFVGYGGQTFDRVGALARLYQSLVPSNDEPFSDENLLRLGIRKALEAQSTLVILDNLESVEDAATLAEALMADNPDTRFIFTTRHMEKRVDYAFLASPKLMNPRPLIFSIIGLDKPIDRSLWDETTQIEEHSPLFWKFLLKRDSNGEIDLKKAIHTYRSLISGKNPENGYRDELTKLQTDSWQNLSQEAQYILIDMALSDTDGVSVDWLRLLSKARHNGNALPFDEAWGMLRLAFLLRPSHGVVKLHEFTRQLLTGEERVQMGWVSKAVLEERRQRAVESGLAGLQQHDTNLRVVLGDFSGVMRLVNRFGNVLFKDETRKRILANELRAAPEPVWQIYADVATIGFEAHKWVEVAVWLEAVLPAADSADTLTKVLAIHEMAMVLCDIMTSRSLQKPDEDRQANALNLLDNIHRSLVKVTPPAAAYFGLIEPLVTTIKGLIFFNTNGPLDALIHLDQGLEALEMWEESNTPLSSGLAFQNTLAFVRALTGIVKWRVGDHVSVDLFRQALAHYTVTGQTLRILWVNSNSALAYNQWLPLTDALQMIDKAIASGQTIGHRWTRLSNLGVRGVILLAQSRLDQAYRHYEDMFEEVLTSIREDKRDSYRQLRHELFDPTASKPLPMVDSTDIGLRREIARLLGNWGSTALQRNNPDYTDLENAYRFLKNDLAFGSIRHKRSHTETRLNLALYSAIKQDWAEAERWLGEAQTVAFAPDYPALRVLWLRVSALLQQYRGTSAVALAHLDEALVIAEEKQRRFDSIAIRLHRAVLRQDLAAWDQAREELRAFGGEGWLDRLDIGQPPILPLMY